MVSCRCGKLNIDGNEFYVRVIGEPDDFERVIGEPDDFEMIEK
jgi:hypothetical protein